MVRNMFWGLILALQFLTRIPLPFQSPWNEQTMKWALRSYPFVGLVIGAILAGLIAGLQPYIPLWMLALVLLSVWVWLTGGLHLDGWMDVADALGSNASIDRKWQIMKDPNVGSFGIISFFFLFVWKLALIYILLEQDTWLLYLSISFTPMLARFGAIVLLLFLPTGKQEGLAWEWKKNLTVVDFFLAGLPILVLMLLFPALIPYFLAYVLFIANYSFWVKRVFEGINGDLVGAAIEGGELWSLALFCLFTWFVMG